MFGGKLTEEVFNAKGSIGYPEAKGHGTSPNVRLLELGLVVKRKWWIWSLQEVSRVPLLRKDEKSQQKKIGKEVYKLKPKLQ